VTETSVPLRVWGRLPTSPVAHRLYRHDTARNVHTTICGIWLFNVVITEGPPSQLCQRCVRFILDRRADL
jgi:hypothetical protein